MTTVGENAMPSALALVPARLGSQRLPEKMLLRETGRYLFQHTVENLRASGVFERVMLATDHASIVEAARSVDIEVIETRPDHQSGTDRIHEAFETLVDAGEGPWDVVVNVQGDEPDLEPEDLARLVRTFDDDSIEMATLATPLVDAAEFADPACVKVVLDEAGRALYFSRAPIPASKQASKTVPASARKHVGVYAFRPRALALFTELPHTELERLESLEQLRWLAHGRSLQVVDASHSAFGIDTPEDYRRFVRSQLPA